jgi:hypothetical protein
LAQEGVRAVTKTLTESQVIPDLYMDEGFRYRGTQASLEEDSVTASFLLPGSAGVRLPPSSSLRPFPVATPHLNRKAKPKPR